MRDAVVVAKATMMGADGGTFERTIGVGVGAFERRMGVLPLDTKTGGEVGGFY